MAAVTATQAAAADVGVGRALACAGLTCHSNRRLPACGWRPGVQAWAHQACGAAALVTLHGGLHEQ